MMCFPVICGHDVFSESVSYPCVQFTYAGSFNQDLSSWNVGQVTDMSSMVCPRTDFRYLASTIIAVEQILSTNDSPFTHE